MGGGGGLPGGGGGAIDGGDPSQPVPFLFSTLGVPNTWAELLFPTAGSSPPAFTVSEVTLSPPLSTTPACPEAFRGAVVLPDGRVLAIPFCVDRFAVIDPSAGTAQWVGPPLMSVRPVMADPPGSYAGAVLGCDLRVYALPHFAETTMMRITLEADGGLTFDELPLSLPGPHRLSGGVLARSCSSGFRIIAAGRGGLFALDPTEGAVAVTPIPSAAAMGRDFVGVARLGDDRVVSAPSPLGADFLTLWVDSNTLAVSSTSGNFNAERRFSLATTSAGDAFVMTPGGTVTTQYADGGMGSVRTTPSARLRWPTNSLTGWVFGAGAELMAWNERTPPPDDVVLLSPAVNDTGNFTSGGLVLTRGGVLVSVPGVSGRSVVTIYTPSTTQPIELSQCLSPWFNKL